MAKEQIVKKLNEIYNMLDELQEEELIQNLGDEGAANSIHEAMGHIDNAIDELDTDDSFLPDVVYVESEYELSEYVVEDFLNNYLSDTYDYCVYEFKYEYDKANKRYELTDIVWDLLS